MPRYKNTRILTNSSDYYSPLRKSRDRKVIRHYATPQLKHPSVLERVSLDTVSHIWKYGDRYYTLAQRYYGDTTYWWVIAWYNGYPTEADIQTGALIKIPLDLENVLFALGL